jgi:hypothetical protein
VTNDLDALLTGLYVEIDDHVVPTRRGQGRRPRLSDAELLTLAAAQVLPGIDTEHRWMLGLKLYLLAAPTGCRSRGAWPIPRSANATSVWPDFRSW